MRLRVRFPAQNKISYDNRLPADTKAHTKVGVSRVSKISTYLWEMTNQGDLSGSKINRDNFFIRTQKNIKNAQMGRYPLTIV